MWSEFHLNGCKNENSGRVLLPRLVIRANVSQEYNRVVGLTLVCVAVFIHRMLRVTSALLSVPVRLIA